MRFTVQFIRNKKAPHLKRFIDVVVISSSVDIARLQA
jgi:hypothetical protein